MVHCQVWLKGHVLFCCEKSAAAQPRVPQEPLYHPFTVNVKSKGDGENDKCRKATLALLTDAWRSVANGRWLRLIAAVNVGRQHGEMVSVSHALLSLLMKSNKLLKLFSPLFLWANEENWTRQGETGRDH